MFRLERDAWSMVKWPRQATSEYAPHPPSSTLWCFFLCFSHRRVRVNLWKFPISSPCARYRKHRTKQETQDRSVYSRAFTSLPSVVVFTSCRLISYRARHPYVTGNYCTGISHIVFGLLNLQTVPKRHARKTRWHRPCDTFPRRFCPRTQGRRTDHKTSRWHWKDLVETFSPRYFRASLASVGLVEIFPWMWPKYFYRSRRDISVDLVEIFHYKLP